jgi:hypothetical protein
MLDKCGGAEDTHSSSSVVSGNDEYQQLEGTGNILDYERQCHESLKFPLNHKTWLK